MIVTRKDPSAFSGAVLLAVVKSSVFPRAIQMLFFMAILPCLNPSDHLVDFCDHGSLYSLFSVIISQYRQVSWACLTGETIAENLL